jgi:hypothetical protein
MEEFDPHSVLGRIVCAELDETGRVVEVRPALERPYHLSYPHVFEHDGEYFMIPESGFNGTVELYHAVGFPFEWELVKVLFRGPAFDTTVVHRHGRFWFFVTLVADPDGYAAQLLLFSSSTLCGDWVMHPSNPITNDARYARGAGRFVQIGDCLVRPAQDCSIAYGRSINLRAVTALDEQVYAETAFGVIGPASIRSASGVHTYSEAGLLEAIDYRTPARGTT